MNYHYEVFDEDQNSIGTLISQEEPELIFADVRKAGGFTPVAPPVWSLVMTWPNFVSLDRGGWASWEFTVVRNWVEGFGWTDCLDILVDSGSNSGPIGRSRVATIRPTTNVAATRFKGKVSELCQKCWNPGKFVRTALICSRCGHLMGGF